MSGAWRRLALAAGAALLLAGCAGTTDNSAPREVLTASDQTDLQRRARVRLELAGAYFSRGQLETALDEVKIATQTAPNLPDAYNLRGLIYAAMDEDRLADDSFLRALQLDPRDGSTMHNRAWFLCQRNRLPEAQRQFQAALDLPQYRDQLRTLLARGVCYGRGQQWAEAEAALMRAYEMDPSNPSTGLNLAEVLFRQQQFERARFYIGRVNDKPENANAQTLWLAARIEHKLGRPLNERVLGDQLRGRFPKSPEAALFERGQFDD